MTHRRIALLASADAMDLDTDGPLLFPALEQAQVDYDVVAWDDPKVKWQSYDAVVLRATWDYFRRVEDFLDVLELIDKVSTLHNPLDVVRWNIDKRYLNDLSSAGLPVVPSAYVAHLSPPTELGLALGQVLGWGSDEVVVKPTVSAGSNDTFRLDAADGSAVTRAVQSVIDSDRVAMLQPYLHLVDSYGERGCVYVNGSFDHAFAKKALLTPGRQDVDGLFIPERVEAVELTDAEYDVAHRTNAWLTLTFGPLLYARIDMLASPAGPMIVEVELIEPSLFMASDPPCAKRFAAAVAGLH
ncbi:MAG: ATP-grasp domain-containing protein [Acidimicrobiales bacterium]